MAPATRKHKNNDGGDDAGRVNKRARSRSPASSDSTLESITSPKLPPDDADVVDQPTATSTGILSDATLASGPSTAPPAVNPVQTAAPVVQAASPATTSAVTLPPAPPVALAAANVTSGDLTFRPAEAEHIPAEFIPRLVSILNFSDAAANRYAIGVMPPACAWGQAGDGSGFERYLCYDGRPVIIWLVGVVTSLWLTPTDSTRASIGVRLVCDRDQQAVRHIQTVHFTPPIPTSENNSLTTYANAWLAARGQGGPSSFEEVFDASDVLGAWSAMRKISSDEVRKTDIVVVECYARRFRTRDQTSRSGWSNWALNFELLRIAHLLTGPGPVELVAEDSAVRL